MTVKTAAAGYRAYNTARFDNRGDTARSFDGTLYGKPITVTLEPGQSVIDISCANGEACIVKLDTKTDKVLDIQGDSAAFIYWEENVKGGK